LRLLGFDARDGGVLQGCIELHEQGAGVDMRAFGDGLRDDDLRRSRAQRDAIALERAERDVGFRLGAGGEQQHERDQ
jgi:hypothetical protein